jgi:drug/metabolite transporter (DMT)-like permease
MTQHSSIVAQPAGGAEAQAARHSLWIGYGCAALGAVLFSTKAIIVKLAYAEGINAETLLALRMGLSLPFFAAVAAFALRDARRSGAELPSRALVLQAGAVGVLGYWFASYTDFLGLEYISAQFERLILFTYPGFVVLFGALFFGQRVRTRAFFAFALSYVGLGIIFLSDFGEAGADVALGAALVMAAAVSFAFYQLLAKEMIGRIGPRLFTCVAMGAAAVPVLAQFALTQPLGSLIVGPKMLVYGLLIAIGATVLPAFLLNAGLQRISAQANSTIGTLSPVITILLAVAVLGEDLTPADAAGAALVLLGVGWFTLADRRRPAPDETP